MHFLPSLNKKSNVGGVLFVESGTAVYNGDNTVKKKRFIDLKQSVDHVLTSG